MKVVIAPDSFKGSLPASVAAQAMARGVVAACPDARIELCPMADGGEGTVEAMVTATGGRFLSADVFGPLGQEIRARYGMIGHANASVLPGEVGLAAVSADADISSADVRPVAVIEMAAASGLELVPAVRRDPLRATTFGTGQLITAALDEGAREIILGVGGSATVDCGFGCMQALGAAFRDSAGEDCIQGIGGGALASVASVDVDAVDPRLAETVIRVACDVTNPLIGPRGAAAVYAPQKGATPESVELLERGLVHAAGIVRDQLGVDVGDLRGAGAAGGLGAGLVAMAGARLENGGKVIAEAVRLRERLNGADLCLTGEGRFDAQSFSGKVPFRVATIAGNEGVSTVCIAGSATGDGPRELFREVRTLVSDDVSEEKAVACAEQLLAERAREVMSECMGIQDG